MVDELHFCSQCGVSIPLTEVTSGAARAGLAAGDARVLCGEHRPAQVATVGSGAGASSPGAVGTAAAAADFQLLFCANCSVSIPIDDERSGRAVREYGSLLCVACSRATPGERERRRKAVELELADDAPRLAPAPSPAPSAAPPSTAASAASGPITRETRMPAGVVSSGGGGGASWGLVILVVLASGAAGFFGWEYFQARGRQAKSAADASRDSAVLSDRVQRALDGFETTIERRMTELREANAASLEDLRKRMSEDLSALRGDLAGVRADLGTADSNLAQRIAKLEGQVGSMQGVLSGLASRQPDPPRDHADAGGNGGAPNNGGGNQPPVAEGPATPPMPEKPPVPDAVDPAVAKLVKDLLESKDAGVRFNAALGLATMKSPAAVGPLAKVCTEDEHVMVRRVAARALGDIRAWRAVPVLVQALEDREVYVAQQANFALQKITNQDFGVTLDSSPRDRKTRAVTASKWWDKNKDSPPEGVCLEPITAYVNPR